MTRIVHRKKLNESQDTKPKSYYYKMYYDDIIEAIIDGKDELIFNDADCEIIIRMYYKKDTDTRYRKSGSYDLPSEETVTTRFSNVVVEIETYEDFRIPDFSDSYVNLVR